MKYVAAGFIRLFHILLILLLSACNKRKSALEVYRSIEIVCDASSGLNSIVASFRYPDQNADPVEKKIRFKIPRDSKLVCADFVEGKSSFMISTSKKLYEIKTDKVISDQYSCGSDGYFDLKDFEASEIPPHIKVERMRPTERISNF